MNTDVMFSSKTDLWETPQDLFDSLNEEFHFTLDVCALPENAKCDKYFTPEQDGLAQDWSGEVCWMNPPYGRETKKWIEKAWRESTLHNVTVVCLLPARTDTTWWHDYIYNSVGYYGSRSGVNIRFLRGRLKFGGCSNPAPFPSCIVIFGSKWL
jgi:phage N-6-adenine-methyltransferase